MTKETSLGNGIKWFARIAATAICLFLVASVIAVFTNIPDAKAITQSEVDKLKNQLSSMTAQRKELEKELKNLDIVNTSDNMSNTMKIVRRNPSIQKDFFSMMEYLI